MSSPPSAEPDGSPQYRAWMIDADGKPILQTVIVATDDDEARAKAQALMDGHAIDLWDHLRFVEHFPRITHQK